MAEQHGKALVPEIRFSGFTDPWEQRKFGDGMDLLTGFPFESGKFSDNGINLIRGMNVKRGYLDLSDSLCMKWKSSEGLEKYLLENEDILIQMDGALIGKSYAKIKESQLPALLVQRVTRARAIPEVSNSDFMYQTIQRDFLKYIILNKTDSAVPHLSLKDIREFPIRVPNLEEQKKIGEYLSNLDNLITLHQRKYDKLCVLKKSMLDKMFPKGGSLYPEIRFAGFTDPWEQRKLGEELGFLRNNTLSRAELSDSEGTVFDIHYGDVLIKYGSVLDAEKADVPKIANDAVANRQTCDCLQDGDVIIADTAEDSAVGKCTELCNSAGKKVFSGLHTMPLRPMRKYASGYLGHYLNSPAFHDQLLPLMQGIKVISVSRSAMEDMTMSVPSVAEQASIGAFFDRLDSLITLHQRKLELLRNIKKSMLDKMFV